MRLPRIPVLIICYLAQEGGHLQATLAPGTLEFNRQFGIWAMRKPIPTPRFGLAVAVVGELVYALGGCQPRNNTFVSLRTVEVFSTRNNTWSRLPSMQRERFGLGAVALGGKVYAVGGLALGVSDKSTIPRSREWNSHSADRSQVTASLEVYDPATRRWTMLRSMPVPRY